MPAKPKTSPQKRATKPTARKSTGLKMKPVQSSVLKAVGYDEDKAQLKIEFKESGEAYLYSLVPRQVYEELMEAESKGQFFEKWVRSKPYPFEQVSKR
jgi:hypothetical protein